MANRLGTQHEPVWVRVWPAVLIGGAWLWLFGPMMLGQTVVGYRDSAYLYYPLFQWIDMQWAAGEVPLWNPYCNFGIPVVADGTSSLFYPGKLVFFLRGLSYSSRYGIYLAIHIPIAAAGAYWLARTVRANRSGATLAAFSFAFGGSVLFQVTNVIFLVSAAWLPFALCCVWKMSRTGNWRWVVGGAVSCSLMILGGDPQMVYHLGLIAAATMLGEYVRRRKRHSRVGSSVGLRPAAWLAKASVRLLSMVLMTSLLSSIQLIPSYFWAQQSERLHPKSAANVYMAAAHIWDGDQAMGSDEIERALLGPPVGIADHSYQFSLPPWSITGMVWPNVEGKPFPKNQRWTQALAGADRVWVPSLYAGVMVILIGGLGMRLWGRRRRQVWITRWALFFGVASLGWYGAVWAINEFFPAEIISSNLGPQVGGLYWAMSLFLPKYFAFRYPAKLFVIAALGISLLAGIRFRGPELGVSRVAALIVLIASAGGIALIVCCGEKYLDSGIRPDRLFGPFDSSGAHCGLCISMVQPALVLLAVLVMFVARKRYCASNRWAAWLPFLIVVLTGIEIMFANHWLVPQVASKLFESETRIGSELEGMRGSEPGQQVLQIYRSRVRNFEPDAWATEMSNERLGEIVTWQRETLFPKHHLGEEVVLIGSFSSIWPKAYEEILSRWEPVDWDANQIAKIADGMIQKRSGQPAELVDFRAKGIHVAPKKFLGGDPGIRVNEGQDLFWIGVWISGVGWAGLLSGIGIRAVCGLFVRHNQQECVE